MRKIDILNTSHEKIELDTVVYINKTIDEVCYVDSDGRKFTYRDIFEGANLLSNSFFETDTIWTKEAGITIVSNKMRFTNVTIDDRAYQSPLTIGQDVYISYEITDFDSGGMRVDAGSGNLGVENSAVGRYSELQTVAGNSDLNIRARIAVSTLKIEYVLAINKGVFTSAPSKNMLDTMCDIYLARRSVAKEEMTLRDIMALNLVPNNRFQDGTEGCNAIDSIIITIVNADAENIFYIDHMYAEDAELGNTIFFGTNF